MTDSIKDLVSKQGTNIAPPGGPGGPGDIGGPGDGLNPPQFDRVPLLDSLSNVFGAESAPATTGTTSRTSTSNATLQALLAALGLGSNSAVGSFMNRTGTASSGTPSSATGTTAPRTTTTTPTPQIGTSYNALSSSQIQSQISQSPSLQAMNARIRALPAEQRAQYVPAERLPKGLLAQATPEEAMPGTVYYNYEPTNPKYFAYDGVGYREIQKRVAPTPGGGLGNYYYLPNGQRWA
jgi:hypothetical protein